MKFAITNGSARCGILQAAQEFNHFGGHWAEIGVGSWEKNTMLDTAFNQAIDRVTQTVHDLLDSLVTTAAPRDRGTEQQKARERSAVRFGRPQI